MNPVWFFFFLNIDIPFLRIDTVSPNKISRYSRVSIFSYTPNANPYLLKHGPSLSPPLQTPPQSYHTKAKKNCELFLCNSKCATHRWVGLYKPPVVTHSPLCALDTFHTLLCNPTKDSAIYVCLHAHALQIILYCSPASCLTHNVSLCTCTVLCEAFV